MVISTSTSDADPAIWTVIPAGGSGTRLWPLSRERTPKFLHPLVGDLSLLQATVNRLANIAPPERTMIVCGVQHVDAVREQVPEIPVENILAEPSPHGSGAAIGLAASLIARQDPTAIMASFAADHVVRRPEALITAVQTAVAAAQEGYLVTIGLQPTTPATGFGYIERTDEVVVSCDQGTAYRASRFVEKPSRERAEEFLASGRYLWNASMFIWQVGRLREEMLHFLPELQTGIDAIVAAWERPDRDQIIAANWPTCQP